MNKTSVTQQAKTTSFLPPAQGVLQRKCACGNYTVAGGDCAECAKNKSGLQRKLNIGASNDPLEQEADQVIAAPASVDRAVDSPSRQLEPGLRKEMEKSFGRDFSHVRVHTDGQAGISSQSIHALAYTLGRDIVFAPNQYSPQTENGRRLLAHELTHVVQQEAVGSSFVQTKPAMDQLSSPFEREADFMADAVTRPQRSPQGRSMGGTLPYREATELLECIRIMGENSRDYCREVVLGEKPIPVEEAPKWTRKHTKGPRLLDGDKPSYQVWFNHILPPVPTGVTKMWQVVENTKTFLTDSCELKTEKDFRVDIVDIGARNKIEDDWGWVRRDDPCFAMEESLATIGFDDQKSKFVEQTNVKVSEADAKDTLGKMAGPIGTYSGKYTFVKSKNCKDCPEKLKAIKEKNNAPNGEALSIEGVGSWKS